MDIILIISVITAAAAIAGLIITNFWNSLTRKDKMLESREALEYTIEQTARAKFLEEQQATREQEKQTEDMIVRIKEELKDYIDKGDLDVKRELAYAIKLVCKDIEFLKRFIGEKENKGAV